INDYQAFWATMSDDTAAAVEQGESHGLRELLTRDGVEARRFQWHDTGSREGLARARTALRRDDAPNILPKKDEDIWFVNGSVIKFSADTRFIADRVRRSRRLEGFCPTVEGAGAHMYKYRRAEGDVLSKTVTLPKFRQLLAHAQT